jgi:hypothetical protein
MKNKLFLARIVITPAARLCARRGRSDTGAVVAREPPARPIGKIGRLRTMSGTIKTGNPASVLQS